MHLDMLLASGETRYVVPNEFSKGGKAGTTQMYMELAQWNLLSGGTYKPGFMVNSKS